jgi:hypothetical protein
MVRKTRNAHVWCMSRSETIGPMARTPCRISFLAEILTEILELIVNFILLV